MTSKLKVLFFLILLLCSFYSQANNKNTIVIGKLVEQLYDVDAIPASCNKENVICHGVYIRYIIDVEETLVGTPIKGRISAVRFQHGQLLFNSQDRAAFVIQKIKSENNRDLLKSDYYLIEHKQPKVSYCFEENIDSYIPEFKKEGYHDKNCITDDELFVGLKGDLIATIIDTVEMDSEKEGYLLEVLHGSSEEPDYGGNYSEEQLEELSDKCYPFPNEHLSEIDPICIKAEMEYRSVAEFKVKPGHAQELIVKLHKLLSESRIGMEQIKSSFKTVNNGNYDSLLWYYAVEPIN